jgi:hypothetical protein
MLVKSLNASKVTPPDEPDIDVLVKIILLFGGSFCVRIDPAEPETKETLR